MGFIIILSYIFEFYLLDAAYKKDVLNRVFPLDSWVGFLLIIPIIGFITSAGIKGLVDEEYNNTN